MPYTFSPQFITSNPASPPCSLCDIFLSGRMSHFHLQKECLFKITRSLPLHQHNASHHLQIRIALKFFSKSYIIRVGPLCSSMEESWTTPTASWWDKMPLNLRAALFYRTNPWSFITTNVLIGGTSYFRYFVDSCAVSTGEGIQQPCRW